jgi:hypothetical protein
MSKLFKVVSFFPLFISALSACTTAKLEARLEANPHCKDVYNAKTGALMPCPGTDRSFYVAAGLEAPRQPKPVTASNTETTSISTAPQASGSKAAQSTSSPVDTKILNTSSPAASSSAVQLGCKPTIHKKTGGMLPCTSED